MRLRQKLTGPDFNEKEIAQVAAILETARSQFPLNTYGHINLPFYTDEEGDIRMQMIDTSTVDGWDCFDSSVELAATLHKAGFSSGISLCRDKLSLFGTHFFPYIEKNNTRFSIDMTPPYYHHNPHFHASTLGHAVNNTHAYSPSAPLKTKRELQKEHGEKGLSIISRNVYPADYLEISDSQGLRGFLFSVSFDQASMTGTHIHTEGGAVRTYLSVIEFAISPDADGPDGPAFTKKTEYAFEFDREASRLVPVDSGFHAYPMEDDIFYKAQEVGDRFSAKIEHQLKR